LHDLASPPRRSHLTATTPARSTCGNRMELSQSGQAVERVKRRGPTEDGGGGRGRGGMPGCVAVGWFGGWDQGDGVAAVAVWRARWSDAASPGVGQRGDIEGGELARCCVGDGLDEVGGGVVHGDPDVAAAVAGGHHKKAQFSLSNQVDEMAGVAVDRACVVSVRVEVEDDESVLAVGVGEVPGVDALRRVLGR
ncbi:hypothetical protein, partial [Nonomuraea sp. NPDC049400]|uniref:hypothetical protein n=1 Tax=Nonomuraea sp. NPDC049400 TaxID=3364352 RepID=UPI003798D269